MPSPTFKTCGCGRAYSYGQWRALPLVGVQRDDDEDGDLVPALVLRDCSCGNTMAVDARREGDVVVTASRHRNPRAGVMPPFRRFVEIVCERTDAEQYMVALSVIGYDVVEARTF